MSNRKGQKKPKAKSKVKSRPMIGMRGDTVGLDAKARAYPVLSTGGLQPGAVAGKALKRGLDGTYAGTCVNCMTPTDTALIITAWPAEHVTFLHGLGMSEAEARSYWEYATMMCAQQGRPVTDQYTTVSVPYRVCAACAAPDWEVREIHNAEMLVYLPHSEGGDGS